MKKGKMFRNPILSGFYPDPSICRVDEDYYLATSSFVYYPGLPIFHSKDLVNWEQIGHGIERPEQLDYKNCETSLGLWAPTIRYHEGLFYIINTFVSEGREARRDNFIITAENPAGPWSDPVFIKGADGIDPSIFFDDNGRMWYCGNYISKEALYEGHHGIYLCELDPETFQFKGERTNIWDGIVTRSKWIEAPHIYKIEGYYYLMVAEGGTFVNHSVMMARSKQIEGPYEICPRNPIVTHRHCSMDRDISVVGHGDLFETQNGEWWMVLLGVRTYDKIHFNTGRETFLIPMKWEEDGWPMVDNEDGMVHTFERVPDLEECRYLPKSGNDSFETEELDWRWNTVHPPKNPFYSLKERKGYLRLYLQPETMEEICCPAFVGRRQQHKHFTVRTVMEFLPEKETEESGISLIQDDRYHYSMMCGLKNRKKVIRLYKTENSITTIEKEEEYDAPEGKVYLTVYCNRDTYSFYYASEEGKEKLLAAGMKADLLSSVTNDGFTGAYIGPYATSNNQKSSSYADYDWFFYEGIEDE